MKIFTDKSPKKVKPWDFIFTIYFIPGHFYLVRNFRFYFNYHYSYFIDSSISN